MANTFHQAIVLFEQIDEIDPGSVWLEIGSERGEGSTMALAGQAQRYNTVLHTVDITTACKNSIKHPSLHCHVAKGSSWAQKYGDIVGEPIALLYLDNFDWTWNIQNPSLMILKQIEEYRAVGQIMNNRRCQVEHLAQIIALHPWLSHNCMIAMDDTFLENQVWAGKCAAVSIYLEAVGFDLVHTDMGGTIMVRGYDMLSRLTIDDMSCILTT